MYDSAGRTLTPRLSAGVSTFRIPTAMTGRRTLIAALAALLTMPAAAAASGAHHHYLAPPGNSAVSQYLEVVPNASGSATERTPAAGGGLSAAERARLQHLGTAGRTLASVVAATTPTAVPRHRHKDKGHPGAPVAGGSGGSGGSGGEGGAGAGLRGGSTGSPVGSVLAAATGGSDGGGLGVLLPIAMIAALAAVAGAALRRRPR